MSLGALLLAGAGVVYLCLGCIHAVLTLRDVRVPKMFTPPDPTLRAAMQSSTVAIHPSSNLWRSWLGFNLSHSLGLVVFGTTLATFAVSAFDTFSQSVPLNVALAGVAVCYVALSRVFWFRDPLIGSSLGMALVAVSALVS